MGRHACQQCGKDFEVHGRKPYRYCEKHRLPRAESQNRAQRDKRTRRREARSPAQCVVCGKAFMAMRSDAKVCPSLECKRLETNRRAREYEERYEEEEQQRCLDCGKRIRRRSQRCEACSQKPRIAKITGSNNYAWKGGRTKDSHGYIRILVASSDRKGHRYRAEHRLVWEAVHGPIPEGYIIHHINGIKDDNRIENLEAMPRRKHNDQHGERRIRELEARIAELQGELDGILSPQVPVQP